MSDIKSIATYINTLLVKPTAGSVPGGQFEGKPFQKGQFYGVAELVKKETGQKETSYTVPKIMDANGNDGTNVIINDTYPFQLYHRIVSQSSEDAENVDTFGDGNDKNIIFDMVLIIFSDRFNTEIDAESYVTALMLDFPRTIRASLIASSQFSKCEINFTETITNKSEVLSQEYGQEDPKIKQSYVCLSFGYEVKLTYNKECFTLC